MSTLFPPSRTAALARLSSFLPHAGRDYARLRNYDLPGHPHVSRLSPYLRHRALTEAEVAAAVCARHSPQAAEKFLQEVCWRSYWKAWLDRRPQIWADYRAQVQAGENLLATQSGLRAQFAAACEGTTGIDGFDAWARELVDTGYLHNHARMWFASIWVFTLRLPWALGADFFMRHLLDGDPASNTLGWRWVAGLHTPGKTYAARADNIARFTEGRHDPQGALLPEAEVRALSGPPLPPLGPIPEVATVPDWDAETGLILTEDDLSPAFLLAKARPRATAILLNTSRRSPRAVSPRVLDWTRALAQEAASRHSARLGEIPLFDTPQQAALWAQAQGLSRLIHPYAPVGPGRSGLRALSQAADLPLTPVIRPWDAAALPHATAGFFKFKAHIPQLLETAGA